MCQPQNPVVKGQTWTPSTAMTNAQRDKRAQDLLGQQPNLDSGGGADFGSRTVTANMVAGAEQTLSQQNAAADQMRLASWAQQAPTAAGNPNENTTVTANKRRNAAGMLTTGGVSMGGGAPTGRTSLLGG